VHGRQDLDTGTKESEITDLDRADIEHDAVEIEKDALPEFDIGPSDGGAVATVAAAPRCQ